MDKSIEKVIRSMKDDNAYFVQLQQNTNKDFSLQKDESKITHKEREIRWFYHANFVIDYLLKENLALKENHKEEIRVLNEKIGNLLLSQKDITTSISTLNERFDDLYDKQISFEENHVPVTNSIFIDKPQIIPPKFSGEKNDRPIHFLHDMKMYLETMKINQKDSIFLVIAQSLENNASDWFYTVQNRIETFEDFERVFKGRYWNEPIQSSLRTKLEVGKYNPNYKKSRVSYAQSLLEIAGQLELDLDEESIIRKISRHFGSELSRTVRNQGINTSEKLYDLLQEYDSFDKSMFLKSQNERKYNNNQKSEQSFSCDPESSENVNTVRYFDDSETSQSSVLEIDESEESSDFEKND